MLSVVDRKNAKETVAFLFYAGEPTNRRRGPDGFQFRSVESAHKMKRQDTYSSRMRVNYDPTASMLGNDLVESARRTIQHLAITFSAEQHVFKVATNKRLILFGMLLGCFLES